MDFRILGPLEVTYDGHELALAGSKQRALLAILLLHANEVVPADRLIDELWGDRPPPSAPKSLQAHVSRLRQALNRNSDSDGVIVTRSGGYMIQVEAGALDRARFERLLAEGTEALGQGDPGRASERLGEALGIWRGPPLADFAYESFAQAEIAHLEELRLTAMEELIEAELALGRHARQIPKLETLVDRHPFRERLRAQLMLALYRSGRQAEALEAYQDARRALVEEMGIEPGEELQELQRAILAHDPSLAGQSSAELGLHRGKSIAAAVEIAPSRRRRALVAGGALAVVLGAVTLVLALATSSDDDGAAAPLTNDSHALAVIDPATNRVTTAVSVGSNPGPIAFERRTRSVWVGNLDDESVTRVDTRPMRVGRTIAIGERPDGIAAGDGVVWVAGATRTRPFVSAHRIDARFDRTGRPIRVESLADGDAALALDRSSLWVAPSNGLLTQLDPRSGARQRPRIELGHAPRAVASDGGTAWVADGPAQLVTRIDARTGASTTIPVAGGPADIALGAGSAWVTLSHDDAVARIDSDSGTVRRTIGVGRRPEGVAVGAGAVWVANTGDGTVSRLDPASGRVSATVPVGASPQDVTVADGRVWVSVRPRESLPPAKTGGTVHVEMPDPPDSLDPALAYQPESWQMLHPTCVKLLTYPNGSGASDARPLPELAEAVPRPSDGGRSYTFTIRRGFRFSPPSGEPVTARSMKYTIDRSMNPRMRSPAPGLLPDLRRVRASGRRLTVTLARPSSTFLHRISLPFFCAVPLGTPIEPEGLRSVPSAGPYYVSSHVRDEEIVLRRNPNYDGARPARPDAVRIVLGAGFAGSLRRIEAGEVDYVPIVSPNVGVARRLAARYGPGSPAARDGRQRYFVHRTLQLDYLVFNTSRSPFSSARLRRAVNYALDRRALARSALFTGLPSAPTDQYLPPGMPGFRDARLYPSTPDLAKARRLAGPTRRTVVLYALGDDAHLRFAEIVKANLRSIGMDVRIRAFGDAVYARLARRGEPFDLALAGWQSDYPDPMDFLSQLDGRTIASDGNVNTAYFDDSGFNRRLDAAEALRSPARELALARLEVDVARRAAPWAAIANGNDHDFFSARIACQAYNPIHALDLGSLCVRGR